MIESSPTKHLFFHFDELKDLHSVPEKGMHPLRRLRGVIMDVLEQLDMKGILQSNFPFFTISLLIRG